TAPAPLPPSPGRHPVWLCVFCAQRLPCLRPATNGVLPEIMQNLSPAQARALCQEGSEHAAEAGAGHGRAALGATTHRRAEFGALLLQPAPLPRQAPRITGYRYHAAIGRRKNRLAHRRAGGTDQYALFRLLAAYFTQHRAVGIQTLAAVDQAHTLLLHPGQLGTDLGSGSRRTLAEDLG